jgi:hypothetical protein
VTVQSLGRTWSDRVLGAVTHRAVNGARVPDEARARRTPTHLVAPRPPRRQRPPNPGLPRRAPACLAAPRHPAPRPRRLVHSSRRRGLDSMQSTAGNHVRGRLLWSTAANGSQRYGGRGFERYFWSMSCKYITAVPIQTYHPAFVCFRVLVWALDHASRISSISCKCLLHLFASSKKLLHFYDQL